MTTSTPRILLSVAAVLIGCAPALADDDRPASRHSYRATTNNIDAGAADRLMTPRLVPGDARVVRALPLRGDDTRTTSTASASTSNLTARSGAPLRAVARVAQSVAPVTPVRAASIVRRATPLVATTAAEESQPQIIDERAAVDNNARLAPHYKSYAPATVTYEQAQLALGAHRVQEARYGNTYGTYSADDYYGRFNYASYPSRTYYDPVGYYGHRSYSRYGHTPHHSYRYTPTYCAPVYYRPSYHYAPTYYHRPVYSSYCGPRYHSSYGSYHRPSYSSFHYSYGRGGHCGGGSRFGVSIGW